MSEKENLNSGDVIHVESYTRADGTDVRAHSRHKPGRGSFAGNGLMAENPYKNSLGGILPQQNYQNPYSFGGIIEPNHIVMDEGRYNPLLSYLPTDNSWQNTNKMIQGVNYSPADLEHYTHQCTTDNMNWGDKIQENQYLGNFAQKSDNYGKSYTAFLNNVVNDFEDAKNDPNATIYDSANSIPDAGLRKFITTNDSITDHGRINVKDMRGAYYNANSTVSQSIAHDPAITEYVKQEYGNLIYNGKKIEEYNKQIPLGGDKYFQSEFISKGNVDLSGDANKWDIAHCTLYNPHIDRDGNFKAQMIDIVDYDNRNYSGGYGLGYIPNQWGYKMQQMGMLENVFHVVDIDIPVNELKIKD